MSVAVSAAVNHKATPRLEPPVTLFQTHVDVRTRDALQHVDYHVSADGQRIITLAAEAEAITPWTVVINWPAAIGAR